VRAPQGDQIGRIFAQWVTVYFWEVFLIITEVAHIFGFCFRVKISVLIVTKNGLGYILGDFLQAPPVTLARRPTPSPSSLKQLHLPSKNFDFLLTKLGLKFVLLCS
jgi:hypothetical protein